MKLIVFVLIAFIVASLFPPSAKAFFDYGIEQQKLEEKRKQLETEFYESLHTSQIINKNFYQYPKSEKLIELKSNFVLEEKKRGTIQSNISNIYDHLQSIQHNEQNFKKINLNVPFFKQQKKLSCEISTLRMSLALFGIQVTELDLEKDLVFSTKERPKNGVWGDPNLGFVGDINGYQSAKNLSGYGVYWNPLTKLAQKYRPNSYAFENGSIDMIVRELFLGNPIIAWGINDISQPIKELKWKTPEGKDILAYERQHTWVIKGFTGTLKHPESFIVLNPLSGEHTVPVKDFASHWKYFGYSGVVVK